MSDSDPKNFGPRLAPWLATAAVTVAALWLTGRLLALRAENQSLRTERMLAEVAYKLGQNQLAERTLLAENMINGLGQKLRHAQDLARLKAVTLLPPDGGSENGRAVVVWDPELQVGLVTAEKMPALPASRVYQVWIVDPASPISVSGGVFRVSTDGRAVFGFKPEKSISLATGFSITAEDKDGGGGKARGPVMLQGK